MAHFLLYIPRAEVDPLSVEATFTKIGLRDLYADAEQRTIETGPDELPGTLCAWRSPGLNDKRFHYNADEQKWIKAAHMGDGLESGRYWVGVWNDSPPTPAELQRHYPLPGKRVVLGDGNEWMLPSLPDLPRDAILQDDGSIRFEIQRKHYALWLEKEKWADVLRGKEFDERDLMLWLGRCLSLNYRMPIELPLSRIPPHDQALFGSHNYIQALTAIVLGMTLEEVAS